MLTVGLVTQITAFLSFQPSRRMECGALRRLGVAAQDVCGVAKDLTKTASKSAIKVAEAEPPGEARESRLFAWVAWFTGSKNAMKGFGFFLGGLLLERWLPPCPIRHGRCTRPGAHRGEPVASRLHGQGEGQRTPGELSGKAGATTLLAAARVMLFGARERLVRRRLARLSPMRTAGTSPWSVDSWLVLTIGYGAVQARATTRPAFRRRSQPRGRAARIWAVALAGIARTYSRWR